MKRALIVTIILMFWVSPVWAHTISPVHGHDDVKPLDDAVVGVKADAPNLVKLTDNWSLGAEVSKDLRRTAGDEGWTYWGKVTYTGSIFDFSGE